MVREGWKVCCVKVTDAGLMKQEKSRTGGSNAEKAHSAHLLPHVLKHGHEGTIKLAHPLTL